MADLSITAASVAIGASPQVDRTANAGTTITAGMCVYLQASSNTWLKALTNGTQEQSGAGVSGGTITPKWGVALHAALSGQPLAVMIGGGQITIGATVVIGTFYCPSPAVAGNIAPLADIGTTGWYFSVLGMAVSTTLIDMTTKWASNVTHA